MGTTATERGQDADGATEERPRRASRWRAAGPVLIGVAGVVGGVQLTLGSLTAPGPGLWPSLVSVILLGCGVWLLLTGRDTAGQETFGRNTVIRTSLGVASLAGFVIAFQVVGFLIPAFALLVFWLRWMGREAWRTTLTVAAVAPVVLHIVFVELLAVPFPADLVLLWWR